MPAHRFLLRRTLVLALFAAQLALAAGCSAPVAGTGEARTVVPVMTTPFASPLPVATRTGQAKTAQPILPTLRVSPLPTATRFPSPSPTPDFYYNHSMAGFSLAYPIGWSVYSEGADALILVHNTDGMFLFMGSEIRSRPTPIADLLQRVRDLAASAGGSSRILSQGSLPLADGIEAIYVDATLTGQYGQSMDLRLASAQRGTRLYSFEMYADRDTLAKPDAELGELFAAIHLFAPQPYGLPRQSALIQLGDDPSARDLDPAVATTSSAAYIGLLYSGLVRLTPSLQIAPDLAESWSLSPDGTVYTFTLRPGLRFASGGSITADSVRFSWERAADPDNHSPTARTYLGDIAGVQEKLERKAATIRGLKVIDARTLQVTLVAPQVDFLAHLTYPTAAVLDDKHTRYTVPGPAEAPYQPNASGPYFVSKYDAGRGMVLERNPNYYNPASIPFLGYMFYTTVDPLNLFQEGTLDLLPVDPSTQRQLSDPSATLHASLVTAPTLCTSMLRLNTGLAPLDDPLVRKALSLATDRSALVELLTENTALPAKSILPPGMPGYLLERPAQAYDPAAAKAALAASKYGASLPPITLLAPGMADSRRQDVDTVVDQLQKTLGITVRVQYLPAQGFEQAVRKKPGNVVFSSWCADYPDPENFLDILFHTGGDFNLSQTSLPALDALFEQARREPDSARRVALYQQAESLLLEGVNAIPLYHPMQAILVSPRLQGYVASPVGVRLIPDLTIK